MNASLPQCFFGGFKLDLNVSSHTGNGVVHRSRSMGLLKIESNELTSLSISSRIKGPVNRSVRRLDLGIVNNSSTTWSFVKHIGVQEIAGFILCVASDVALLSETIDKVAIVWVGVVECGSHKVVWFLFADIGIGIVVANCPVVEGISITCSSTIGNRVETNSSSVDHVMVVSTVSPGKFLLKARIQSRDDGNGVVVPVDDPRLVAIFWCDHRSSLAGGPEMIPWGWVKLDVTRRIESFYDTLVDFPGLSKFWNTGKTTIFDVAIG